MRLVFRGLFGVATALLVLAVLGTAIVYYLAAKSLPTYDKSLSVANLSNDHAAPQCPRKVVGSLRNTNRAG